MKYFNFKGYSKRYEFLFTINHRGLVHPRFSHTYQFFTSINFSLLIYLSYNVCLWLSDTVKPDMGHVLLVKNFANSRLVLAIFSFCVNFLEKTSFKEKYRLSIVYWKFAGTMSISSIKRITFSDDWNCLLIECE